VIARGLTAAEKEIDRLEQQRAELVFQNSQQGGKIESMQNTILELQAKCDELQEKLAISEAMYQSGAHYQAKCDELVALNAELNVMLTDLQKPCDWVYDADEYSYETACGHKWQFVDGDRHHNDCAYCMYCGGRIVDAKSQGVQS
jgi:hypothetical protein